MMKMVGNMETLLDFAFNIILLFGCPSLRPPAVARCAVSFRDDWRSGRGAVCACYDCETDIFKCQSNAIGDARAQRKA